MSRANKKNKTGRSKLTMTSFVALERFILDCPAWLSLGLAARSAYVEVARLYSGENNGRIGLSARTLSTRLNVSKSTAAEALRELQTKGFVDVAKPGGFNLKTGDKRGTEWRLTRWQCNVTHVPPTRAFMNWKLGTAKPKKKITVRPLAHNGAAKGTQDAKNTPQGLVVSPTPDRNALFDKASGAPGRTHIDIYHPPHSPAQAGAARQGASAMPSPHTLTTDTFQIIGGLALQSIAHLEIATAANLKGWEPLSNPKPHTIPAELAA
jgi:Iron dependent repressor, N-terminal DNA binding domain